VERGALVAASNAFLQGLPSSCVGLPPVNVVLAFQLAARKPGVPPKQVVGHMSRRAITAATVLHSFAQVCTLPQQVAIGWPQALCACGGSGLPLGTWHDPPAQLRCAWQSYHSVFMHIAGYCCLEACLRA